MFVWKKSHPCINLALEIVCVQSTALRVLHGSVRYFSCSVCNRKQESKWNNLKPSRSGSKTVHTFQGARVPCANIVGMYTERRNIRNSILRQDRDDNIIGTALVRKRKRQTSIHQTRRRSVSVSMLAADVLILAVRCYWHNDDKSFRTPPAYILIILLYTYVGIRCHSQLCRSDFTTNNSVHNLVKPLHVNHCMHIIVF